MNDYEKIIDFLLNVYSLKELKRSGWVKKANIKDAESVASHTFGMALIALILGYENVLDSILIHDIAESVIGDLTPEEKNKKIKLKENLVLKDLLKRLPKNSSLKLLKSLKSLQHKQIIKEIDKLDMALQALYYKNKGYNKNELIEFIHSAEKEIKNKKLKALIKIIKSKF